MENDNNNVLEGTQSQFEINSTNGGELVPVNQDMYIEGQPSGLEMAASIAVTMAVGYGIGKLGEFLFDRVIGPAAKKVGNKFDEKMAKKNKKGHSKDKNEDPEVINGEFVKVEKEENSDENQDEQPLPKKGMKSIETMRKKRKH